jgi:hypothetical protein
MRALMSLDSTTRSHVVDSESDDEAFNHLKIECRSQQEHHQHEPFAVALFNQMKSVQ